MFNYFIEIILSPRKTTAKILDENLPWGKILLVILIYAIINTVFGSINFYVMSNSVFLVIPVIIAGIPTSILLSLFMFCLFHISALIFGGKGELRKLSSVLSFVYIIGIIGSILGLVQALLLQTQFLESFETGVIMDVSNPVITIVSVIGLLISAIISYYAHFVIEQNYNLSKNKAIIAAYVPFILILLYYVFVMSISVSLRNLSL